MSLLKSKTEGKNLRIVLHEGTGTSLLSDAVRAETLSALLDNGFEVTRPASGVDIKESDASSLLVLGQFEEGKPPQWQHSGTGTKPSFRDITDLSQDEIVELAKEERDEMGTRKLEEWKPWFPVIDYDRCTNCMQCLSFCLFDVYGVDEDSKITVRNESKCKTDCPACSRVCPEVAILFPKYRKGPINGDVVRQEDIQREAMKVDISDLLGGDIYASLRSRSTNARKRFSTERDESKALLERKRCLKKLKKDLDIPDEVLMSLPSAGDITERAARAKAKLKKRRAQSQSVMDNNQRPAQTEDDWGI